MVIGSGNVPKRVLLLGYKSLAWTTFSMVLDAPDVSVVGVVTREVDKNTDFWRTIHFKNIPCFSSIKEIGDLDFDLGISVNYWELLRRPLLDFPRLGFVNVHHSYNLRFRGRHCTTFAIQRARMDNIWHHGSTLHFIEEQLDAGKIIASQACPIYEKDTAAELFERVEILSCSLLKEWLPRVWREKVIAYDPPNEFHVHRNSDLKDKYINVDEDPLVVYDKVRSMTFPPYPSPYGFWEGRKRALLVSHRKELEIASIGGSGRDVYWGDFVE